ncbi:MAG TPA: hypothetical protein VLE95_03380 [Chlamydiales bacterium]|nr:hypothetical protein [Chlamydiales bacterium]
MTINPITNTSQVSFAGLLDRYKARHSFSWARGRTKAAKCDLVAKEILRQVQNCPNMCRAVSILSVKAEAERALHEANKAYSKRDKLAAAAAAAAEAARVALEAEAELEEELEDLDAEVEAPDAEVVAPDAEVVAPAAPDAAEAELEALEEDPDAEVEAPADPDADPDAAALGEIAERASGLANDAETKFKAAMAKALEADVIYKMAQVATGINLESIKKTENILRRFRKILGSKEMETLNLSRKEQLKTEIDQQEKHLKNMREIMEIRDIVNDFSAIKDTDPLNGLKCLGTLTDQGYENINKLSWKEVETAEKALQNLTTKIDKFLNFDSDDVLEQSGLDVDTLEDWKENIAIAREQLAERKKQLNRIEEALDDEVKKLIRELKENAGDIRFYNQYKKNQGVPPPPPAVENKMGEWNTRVTEIQNKLKVINPQLGGKKISDELGCLIKGEHPYASTAPQANSLQDGYSIRQQEWEKAQKRKSTIKAVAITGAVIGACAIPAGMGALLMTVVGMVAVATCAHVSGVCKNRVGREISGLLESN